MLSADMGALGLGFLGITTDDDDFALPLRASERKDAPAAAPAAAPVAAPAPAAEKAAGSDGSGDDSALPSTTREPSASREYRDVGDNPGAKRFKVSEDRAGHAG